MAEPPHHRIVQPLVRSSRALLVRDGRPPIGTSRPARAQGPSAPYGAHRRTRYLLDGTRTFAGPPHPFRCNTDLMVEAGRDPRTNADWYTSQSVHKHGQMRAVRKRPVSVEQDGCHVRQLHGTYASITVNATLAKEQRGACDACACYRAPMAAVSIKNWSNQRIRRML